MQAIQITRRQWLQAAVPMPLGLHPMLGTAVTTAGAIDLMPDFWRVYDASRLLALSVRSDRVRRAFFERHEATYQLAGFKLPDDMAVTRWLTRFDGIEPGVRKVHRRFAQDLGQHGAAFLRALPDFDPHRSTVYLMPSMDRFDAHLEPHATSLPLFFAPDGIVRYHGASTDLRVLFMHEMFHCYQGQMNAGMAQDPQPQVDVTLWMEGGATYASERLNPGASLRRVLLDDEALLQDGPRTAARVAAVLLDHIDATDDATLNSLFAMGWSGPWPSRAGYYVGLLVARDWARTMSLQQMASMTRAQVRTRSVQSLQRIAAGS